MYLRLWQRLPGPAWMKLFQALFLLLLVAIACFRGLFPAISEVLQPAESQVVGLAALASSGT